MVKYIVQPGDTLGNIAVKYDTTVSAIVRANGIKNPNMIYPGQVLKIPSKHYEDVKWSSHAHDMHHDGHHHAHHDMHTHHKSWY